METVTTVPISTFTYRWVLRNFASLCFDKGTRLWSPEFEFGSYTWAITFTSQSVPHTHCMDFSLILKKAKTKRHPTVNVEWNLTVPQTDKNYTSGMTEAFSLLEEKNTAYFTAQWNRKEITSKYLDREGNLTMDCIIRMMADVDHKTVTAESAVLEKLEDKATICLRQSMQTLLTTGMYSDAVIHLDDGTEIQVHRLILRMRSEYFDRMFSHDMKESKEGLVKIEGVRTPVMRTLLEHIYTGMFPNLNTVPESDKTVDEKDDNAAPLDADEPVGKKAKPKVVSEYSKVLDWWLDLLVIADRFQLEAFAEYIESFVAKSVSADNVCELLAGAYMSHNDRLKNVCLTFINQSREMTAKVMDTEGFAAACKQHSEIFKLVMEASLGKETKPSKKRKADSLKQ